MSPSARKPTQRNHPRRSRSLARSGLLAAFLATRLATPALAQPPGTAPDPAWGRKMRQLEQSLQEVLADVSSDRRFNDPANRARIQAGALRLSRNAHDLAKVKQPPADADPSLAIIAGAFDEQAERAHRELKRGNRAYARELLRSVTSYCFACHTRTDKGPAFGGASLGAFAKDLKPWEKAQYLVATRQFDEALSQYEALAQDPKARKESPLEWEKAVKRALALAIRVKGDPARAQALVEAAAAGEDVTYSFRQLLGRWKEALAQWKAEPAREGATEEGVFAESVRLLSKAKEAQEYPADRGADILYLRASRLAHELLSRAPSGRRAADALYLLGICYETLGELGLWELHELYYRACIEKAPGSEIALRCFRNYESAVYRGYTGSAGTEVPDEELQDLRQLRARAMPETTTGAKPR